MNIVGPPLGKTAVVPLDFPDCSINQALVLFRPKPLIYRHFLYYILCSGLPYSEILAQTRGSAGQSNISLSQCREMPFPIPTLKEQYEIVRRVEKLFAFADQIESRLKQAQARVNRLTQSLLAKAFRGELVPTEAELARQQGRPYESAKELLARIRATQTTPTKRTRSKAGKE
jgi:type I restriction enzyme S subunit